MGQEEGSLMRENRVAEDGVAVWRFERTSWMLRISSSVAKECESACMVSASNIWSAKIMHEEYFSSGSISSLRRTLVLPKWWTSLMLLRSLTSSPSSSSRSFRFSTGTQCVIMWTSLSGSTSLSSCCRMSRTSRRQPQKRMISRCFLWGTISGGGEASTTSGFCGLYVSLSWAITMTWSPDVRTWSQRGFSTTPPLQPRMPMGTASAKTPTSSSHRLPSSSFHWLM
mmetsp:Transcript_75167/g.220348  ORF Transcript_75167/g.220348 Transcript_75167/m.220348 type:complete len:226 (+) Transcript_75167:672-1349(+)